MRRDPAKSEARNVAKQQKQQERAAAEAERQREAQEAAWWASPRGKARAAKLAGHAFFQVSLDIEAIERTAIGVFSGDHLGMRQRAPEDQTDILEGIEAEGWRLEHVGFVFQETGAVSRDKLLSTGQVQAVTGRIVGIYLFRAAPPPPPAAPA